MTVTSPMLIMNNEKLRAKSVTFTQDNTTGTRTTLELCNENAFSLGPSMGNETGGDSSSDSSSSSPQGAPGQKGIGSA